MINITFDFKQDENQHPIMEPIQIEGDLKENYGYDLRV